MALVDLPDPRAPVSRMDMLAMGADATRHGLLGCVLGHGNGSTEEQARNYLRSLWNAAEVSSVSGETPAERQWRVEKIKAELSEWYRRLEAWERGNVVVMPQPVAGHPASITERPPPPPTLTAASKAELAKLERLRAQRRDEESAAAAADAEREGTTTH
jgi:hypothetical protein